MLEIISLALAVLLAMIVWVWIAWQRYTFLTAWLVDRRTHPANEHRIQRGASDDPGSHAGGSGGLGEAPRR